METFCAAFPVLPGKEQASKDFGKACMGPRRKERSEYLKRVGITKEAWYLQNMPQGSIVLVYFEASNAAKAFETLAMSKEPFDVWFKDQVLQITGFDLSKPPAGPPPEQIFSMTT
jgi:hypothetical protein